MPEHNNPTIALYMRLSNEDAGAGSGESNSIKNQRTLLNQYLDKHPELSHHQRLEFIDDAVIIGLSKQTTIKQGFISLVLLYF